MPAEPASTALAATLGRALRAARLRQKLTTRQAAALAGVSQPFLSNVESGRSLPSVPSLYALAGALGIAAAELLPESFAPLEVTRAGAGTPLPLGDEPDSVESLGTMSRVSGSSNHRLDVYLLELLPGYRADSTLSHPGEDLAYVLEGSFEIGLDGESHLLGPGDSLWWDGVRPHSFRLPEPATRVRAVIATGSATPTSLDQAAVAPGGTAAPDRAVDGVMLASGVGRAVRAERVARGLSMRELAHRASVSQPFLSNIENGRSLPSVPLLYAIAAALDVPPSRIMPARSGAPGITHSDAATTALDESGSVAAALSVGRDRLLQAHHLVLQPGYRQEEESTHGGDDFVHVLAGELLVHVGDESVRLRSGDSARFDAQLPHRLSVPLSAPSATRALLVAAAG